MKFRYVLTFTMPDGKMLAAGQKGKEFELVPVTRDFEVDNVLAWNTPLEVKEFWDDIKKTMGAEWEAKVILLKPRIARITPVDEKVSGHVANKLKSISNKA